MAQTVIGLFENENEARRAVEQLEAAGISRSNVDVSRSSNHAGDTGFTSNTSDTSREHAHESGITRFFKNLFGDDDDDADRYSRVSRSGDYSIVTVHAQSGEEAERAADLLDDYGAVDVDERAAQYDRDRQDISSDREGFVGDRSRDRDRDRDATIERVEENLNVGKREVERGGVRVRSRIVEKPVEETLRLREEHVTVERNPVDRPLGDTDRDAFQERNIELTERAEVPVVNKEARVVEEIRVNKDVNERTETVRDTVRKTEVDVDNIRGDDTTRRNDDPTLRSDDTRTSGSSL